MTMTPLLTIPSAKLPVFRSILDDGRYDDVNAIARDTGTSFDVQLLTDLQARALTQFADGSESGLDAWLAPRLHNALRLRRRQAADPGTWAWLAATVLRAYSVRRWPSEKGTTWWRYESRDLLRNGISRLWWGAELIRSGPDYSLVPVAFRTVRSYMFISELRYSWHREAARAFTRLLADCDASDDRAMELSKLFNVYLKTRALEQWDHYRSDPHEPDYEWFSRTPSLADVTQETFRLVGPQSGYSERLTEECLYNWLEDISGELPRP